MVQPSAQPPAVAEGKATPPRRWRNATLMALSFHTTPGPKQIRPASFPRPVTPAALLAYLLEREGYAAEVLMGDYPAVSSRDIANRPAQLMVLLRQPVAPADLCLALRLFHDVRPTCCLLVGRHSETKEAYGERLVIDEHAAVLRVERHYGVTATPRNRLVGAIVAAAPGGNGSPSLRPTLRAILRHCLATGGTIQAVPVEDTGLAKMQAYEGALVERLSPDDLRRLTRDLGWTAVAENCYASPEAQVAPEAFLRGPLLIGDGVRIGPADIHIGPAFLRPGTAAVTIGAKAHEHAEATEAIVEHTTHSSTALRQSYFSGPATSPRPTYERAKRVFDVLFAATALLAMLPIMILAGLIVKLTDGGPIFFIHEREGLGGRPFGCIKFRTMIVNAEAIKEKLQAANQVDGPQFKIVDDPRVTWIGSILRKTNIDELPQFWNVLRGDMSVVGPRPSPFKENQLCAPWREARLSVKPGITGLWQISRSRERGAADFQEWIFYDTQYVERRSFWLDIRIILLTVKEILGKGH